MKMALGELKIVQGKVQIRPGGNTLVIVDVDNVQFSIIKSWNKMRWDKKSMALIGTADLELLNKLADIVRLPANIEKRRQQMRAVADAVDRERMNDNPEPFYKYPVKMPLYAHQVRGANMCLLTFGWTEPKGVAVNG